MGCPNLTEIQILNWQKKKKKKRRKKEKKRASVGKVPP
jgi:hypothetical protein